MAATITIITVTYNAARTINYLINSLRAQTDRDFEWIIADGASNDGTVDFIHQASDVVTAYISEPDFGIYHAINKALSLARGEYYLVLGADDILYPSTIADYKSWASHKNADLITARVNGASGRIYAPRGYPALNGASAYVSLHSVGTLIKRKLHDHHGEYSRSLPIAADSLFIKLAAKRGLVVYADNFIAGEFSDGGVSSKDKIGALCEFYRVQLATGENKYLASTVFIYRLIKYMLFTHG